MNWFCSGLACAFTAHLFFGNWQPRCSVCGFAWNFSWGCPFTAFMGVKKVTASSSNCPPHTPRSQACSHSEPASEPSCPGLGGSGNEQHLSSCWSPACILSERHTQRVQSYCYHAPWQNLASNYPTLNVNIHFTEFPEGQISHGCFFLSIQPTNHCPFSY